VEEKLDELLLYRWTSLHGYLNEDKREGLVDYSLVLADYGGDTEKGRNAYRKQIVTDISENLDVKSNIFAQSILGNSDFIQRVKVMFVGEKNLKEQPPAGQIKHYQQKEAILELIERKTGKGINALKDEKGDLRRITMDLLYRWGGLKGPEIGALFGISYSAVSQERKRLWSRFAEDIDL
jgi:REP-associated tyrosine transposase